MAAELIVKLTTQSFDQAIQSDKPILVDFWAEWCAPCRMIAPILEDLSVEKQDKLAIGKLNVDEHPSVAQKLGIMSIPTLMVFKNGKAIKTLVGYMSKQDMLNKLADVL
jgi:thioredoxin 1